MDKGRRSTRVTISMDNDTKARLKQAAYEQRTTASALIQRFIWDNLTLTSETQGEIK